jgi:hypothetical protein
MAKKSNKRPSVKDEETYESLRESGASKEKAARIANSGKKSSKKGGKAPPYEEWTKNALYERAKEIEIDGRSTMNKAELIEALRKH